MSGRVSAVAEHLRQRGVRFAVVGAAAMSTHGFPRQTFDFDFLTTDRVVLETSFWDSFADPPTLRRGDVDDPLFGVARFDEPPIDIIVGRSKWQSDAVARAIPMRIGDDSLPVVKLADLILLKLDAGGYRDAADIQMMLSGTTGTTISDVESALSALDQRANRLWSEIRAGRR
jgi:hypothetical protein